MLDDSHLIRAGAQEHPLIASRRSVRAFEGQTVAQIVQAAGLDAGRGLPQVTLWREGRAWTVPLDQWGRVRPKRGATVDIHYDTQGPGAIAAVASTALSASAGSIATFLFPGLTGLGLTLATTAITVVGGLLINSLIAPPEQGGGNSDPNFAITGTGNVDAPYRPVPLVCGRHRMFPPKSASGYSETVDGDIYWRGRYCLGWGRVGLEDLRIGNTPITEFDDVEIEFLNVDKDYTLANVAGLDDLTQVKTAEEQAPGAVLREITETYEFEPQSVAGAVTLRIVPNDKLPGYGYNFRVDTREAGGAWVAGTPYSGQTAPVTWSSPVYADGTARTFRVILTAIQEPPEGQEVAPILALVHRPSISVTRATAEYQDGYAIKSWRFGAERMSLYPGDVAEEQMNVLLEEDTPVVRLTAKDAASAAIDISYPQGLYDSDDGETQRHEANFAFRYQRVGAATWTDAGTERHEADAQTLIRFTKSINFPAPGEYRVEVTRTDPIDTDSGDQNRGYLTAIRSFANTRLPSHKRVAEIAVRIKATDQLNGQIDSLNAIVQQFAPKWTGTGWGPQEPVRHPAWVFAELLRGPHLDRPVADAKIDRNALKAWADEEPHWTFDHVFDAETRVADAIRLVAAAGRAKPHLADLRYSVIRDGADGPIRQVFTPRNSWGFKGTLAFSREIHGFRVRFRSERLQWEQDEITVYLDGYDEANATEFEALELPGVVITDSETDRGNPHRLARYHLATAILRPETYEWQADFEHLAVTRGDKVQLVHDVPQIGVGQGRIVDLEVADGNLVALTLDDVQPGAGGIDFRLIVRRADGVLVRFSADNGNTLDGRWVATETVSAAGIGLGDLVAIEKTTQESMEVLITGIYQQDDLAARLVGVPAAPAVLTADTEAIPAYDPIITRLPSRYGPPQPVPTRVFSDAASATKARDGVLRVRIGVELQQYEGPPGVWLRLRWSDPLRGGWIEGERVRPTASMFTGEVPEGLPVAVEVRAEDRDGNHRGWVRAGDVNGSPGLAPGVPGPWAGKPGIRDVIITGTRPADVRGWNVYEAQAEVGPYRFLTFIDTIHAAFQPSAGYTWFRLAAVNYSDQEGPQGAPFQIVPTGVRAEDLVQELREKYDAAADRHDVALSEAEGTLGELRDAAIAAYGDYSAILGGRSLFERIETLEPGLNDAELRLDTMADQVAWSVDRVAATRQLIADAGIAVDPESGQVVISGVHRLDEEIGTVRLDLDAANAEIALRATRDYVSSELTKAQLDPTYVPDFENIQADIVDVQTRLSAAEGTIEDIATSTEIDGLQQQYTEVSQTLDALEGSVSTKAEQQSLTDATNRLSTVEVAIETIDGPSITQTVIDTRQQTEALDIAALRTLSEMWRGIEQREVLREGVALVQSEVYASVNEQFEAEAAARDALAVRIDGVRAAVLQETRVRVTENEALALSLTELEAALGDTNDELSGTATAVSGLSATVTQQGDEIAAVASDLVQLESEVGGNAASIQNLSATRVTASGAVAAVNSVVSASFNDLAAMVEVTAQAEATIEGIRESYVVELGGDDVLSFVRVDDGGTPSSSARIRSDWILLDGNTRVAGDFFVDGANIGLNGDTAVAGDFIVGGGNIFLNGDTAIAGDFRVVGSSIRLTSATFTDSSFVLAGRHIVLDGNTTVNGTFKVTEDILVAGRHLVADTSMRTTAEYAFSSQTTIASLSVAASDDARGFIGMGFEVKGGAGASFNWKLFADLGGGGVVIAGRQETVPSGSTNFHVNDTVYDHRNWQSTPVTLTLVVEPLGTTLEIRGASISVLQPTGTN